MMMTPLLPSLLVLLWSESSSSSSSSSSIVVVVCRPCRCCYSKNGHDDSHGDVDGFVDDHDDEMSVLLLVMVMKLRFNDDWSIV